VKQGKVTAEFKRDALRILSTSGRMVAEVAADLGIGKSTLQRWKTEATETELLSGPHPEVEKELARLRHENKILRQERDLLKNNLGWRFRLWREKRLGLPWPLEGSGRLLFGGV
jgi:transposase